MEVEIKSDYINWSIASDGVLCYDLLLDIFIKPEIAIEFIEMDIKISPTGIEF